MSEHASVFQYQNDQQAAGINVDFDEAYSAAGMWNHISDAPLLCEAVCGKIGSKQVNFWPVLQGTTAVSAANWRELLTKNNNAI